MTDHDSKRLEEAFAKINASAGLIDDVLAPREDQARLDREYVGKQPPCEDEKRPLPSRERP
jgi:hypothetical protein